MEHGFIDYKTDVSNTKCGAKHYLDLISV